VEPPPIAAPPPPPPPVEQVAASAAAAPAVTAPVSEEAASAAGLRDEALDLLKKAKNPEAMAAENPEAMAKASAALEADPTDAMPYLVLGSALQDAGRWREAHRAYELCVKNAKHGMVDECRAMLRAR
jgi:cytochrome c-type biogenesis protein CcmH/NrfG